jgi:putative ABC transport system substrate-binding protein
MDRRTFIVAMIGGLSAVPLPAGAQQDGKILRRVGFLGNGSSDAGTEPLDAFRRGLRELGWIEGQTLTIEYRWAGGHSERLLQLAAELVEARSDIIIVSGGVGVEAARRATKQVPIVIAAILADPVAAGYVSSLARPGGNITGIAAEYEDIVTKELQLLVEAIPGLSRLALLWNNVSARRATAAAVVAAAEALGLKARMLEVGQAAEFEGAFRTARDGRAQAIHVLPSPFFNFHRRLLIGLAQRYRLPAMYEFRDYVQDGGLMSYGVDLSAMYRRAAGYVDQILKGAKPGELPIERPITFEFALNLKTAKALGLSIPQSVLQRADQVIE